MQSIIKLSFSLVVPAIQVFYGRVLAALKAKSPDAKYVDIADVGQGKKLYPE
jgi:hypothetical protein